MKTHIKIHTGEKTFVCEQKGCDKKYATYSMLINHMTRVHGFCKKNGKGNGYGPPYEAPKIEAEAEAAGSPTLNHDIPVTNLEPELQLPKLPTEADVKLELNRSTEGNQALNDFLESLL